MLRDNRPLVLFRTPYFGGPVPLDGVGPELRSHFTGDQSRLAGANAVVFHVPDWRGPLAEGTPKYPGQLWVMWSMESAVNYPRMVDPGVLRHVDLRVTYETAAEIWSPYLPRAQVWAAALSNPPAAKTESAPLVMFQSANIDASNRNAFSRELMHHIAVDSFGRVHRTRQLERDNGRQTKLETIARYHFCLGLENSIAPGYVTEKLYDPLLAGTIPVYRGAPDAAELAPGYSFIDADAYGGPAGLAEYLRHLLRNPAEYQRYFEWRERPLPEWLIGKMHLAATSPWIRLLERLGSAPVKPRQGWPRFPLGRRAGLLAKSRSMLDTLAGRPAQRVELL